MNFNFIGQYFWIIFIYAPQKELLIRISNWNIVRLQYFPIILWYLWESKTSNAWNFISDLFPDSNETLRNPQNWKSILKRWTDAIGCDYGLLLPSFDFQTTTCTYHYFIWVHIFLTTELIWLIIQSCCSFASFFHSLSVRNNSNIIHAVFFFLIFNWILLKRSRFLKRWLW